MGNEAANRVPVVAGELIDKGFREGQFDNPFAGGESDEAWRAAAEETANRMRNRAWSANLGRLLAGPLDDPRGGDEKRPTSGELFEHGLRKLGEPAETPKPALNQPGTLSRNLALFGNDEHR